MATPRPRREKRVPHYESAAYLSLVARAARNLRVLRNERRWTQEEAGARCGMLMQQYQRIEGGRVNLTFATLARLAAGFGVDAHTILAPAEVSAAPNHAVEIVEDENSAPDEVIGEGVAEIRAPDDESEGNHRAT
ncbi:MAG: helix-turn-helix transcriptional regulator [Deltaproteobacteria bacterium]|nr:helix-turn-helix transcriptional regulator [Myxococcales bacterium]MDP3216672.1 helix-turn-helix transcriptional regulator [Deltaproteobacteria bacterium]